MRCNRDGAIMMIALKRIHLALGPQGRGGYKHLLGCTAEELTAHLEAKFTPGISWDNYGASWEMDHVLGICEPNAAGVYPTDTEKRARLHFTNIQPLTVADHLVKTATAPRVARAPAALTDADVDAILLDVLG